MATSSAARRYNKLTQRARALAAGLAASLLAALPVQAGEPLKIVTVNYPLAYFAERIAGEAAEVAFPVPKGRDPAFWKPSIAEIGAIQQADLIVLNGAAYAKWTTKASLPRRALLDTSAGFAERFIPTKTITHSHGAEGEHSHTGVAAIVWLDFDQAAQQAEAIAKRLARAAPDSADAIAANLEALKVDLAALDAEAKALATEIGDRPLLASHPRYQYLARRYGLNLEAMEWDPAEPPTGKQWAQLDAVIARHPARVMIWEAAPLPEVAALLTKRGVDSVVFETAANLPAKGDFLAAMRRGLEALRAAL